MNDAARDARHEATPATITSSTDHAGSDSRYARRALAGLMLAFALLALVAVLSWRQTRDQQATAVAVAEAHHTLERIARLESLVLDLQMGQRGYVLTGDPAYLAPYHHAIRELPAALSELQRRVSNDVAQAERVRQLEPLIAERVELARDIVTARDHEGFEASVAIVVNGVGRRQMEGIRAVIDALDQHDRELLRRYEEVANRSAQGIRWVIASGYSVSGLLLAVAFSLGWRENRQRRRAEADAREHAFVFHTLFEYSPDALIVVDAAGRIERFNRHAQDLFGYGSDEATGQQIELLVPATKRSAHVTQRAAYAAAPVHRAMGAGAELVALRKDGSTFPVDVMLNALPGQRVIAVVRDITEQKRTAEEIARSNAELQQFAYVASHDLQEPLRAVAGCMQLLASRYQGKLDARADELIAHAVDGAQRMQQLITDLLAYSRAGGRDLARQETDLDALLDEALRNLAVAVRESGATIRRDPLPHVAGDPVLLIQLWQNLVGNAVKYHSERAPVVEITARRLGDRWELAVRDNGIGIESQYFERIFGVFQRLHTRREYSGTGIGLALCKRIVERHGGNIRVESIPGEGSTFIFTLPAAPP